MQIAILPGLDGTDALLSQFVALAPDGCTATVISLPDDPAADYDSLPLTLAPKLERLAPCHLIAESFSGPIGIRIASQFPEIVSQLTLVASFATSPAPWIARCLPWSMIFRVPLPQIAIRFLFTGADREMAARLRLAIRRTSIATLAKRLHCVLDVDVCSELKSLPCPIRYLRATRDRLVPASALRTILDVNSHVRVHEIDGPHLIL